MPDGAATQSRIAVVDYGMGNLFSVRQACLVVGLDAVITERPADVLAADAVILPGIGGFPDAMRTLEERGLVKALRTVAQNGTPLVGICLGMQLLMDESQEFGRHAGLGLLPGTVERFPEQSSDGRRWKVPQVGWNQLRLEAPHKPRAGTWDAGGLIDGDMMYFVHSFHVRPADGSVVVARAAYAGVEFCASLRRDNVVGWQFHPERSGPRGLQLYRCLADHVQRTAETRHHA